VVHLSNSAFGKIEVFWRVDPSCLSRIGDFDPMEAPARAGEVGQKWQEVDFCCRRAGRRIFAVISPRRV
jgi:hypothetical protein